MTGMSGTYANVTLHPPKPGSVVCATCHKRPGAVAWEPFNLTGHGLYTWRCHRCSLAEQTCFAWKRTRALPGLVWRLAGAVLRGN